MTAFWVYAVLIIALALIFVLFPLLRKNTDTSMIIDAEDRQEQNIKIFKERLAELEKELAAGVLDNQTFTALKAELELGLLDDVDSGNAAQASGAGKETLSVSGQKPYRLMSALLTLATIGFSLALYFKIGAYDDQKQLESMRFAPAEIAQAREAAESGDMGSLVDQLYSKLKTSPDNVEGWMLLSRTAMNMENYGLAAEGFQTVVTSLEKRGEDASAVYGLLAQARYFESGGMSIAAQAAVSQALSKDPNEVNAIGLKAIHAFDQKNYGQAAGLWESLLTIAPEHPARGSIEAGIARARAMAGMPSMPMVARSDEPTDNAETNQLGAASINVSVALGEAFLSDLSPSDTVFVFARAVSGPPMPLAASKHMVSELPLSLVLDDSKSMSPQLRLSSANEVRVMARVSKSGQPIAQPGDIETQAVVVSTRANASANLVLDQKVSN